MSDRNGAEGEIGQRLSTEQTASLVGMASPRAATMETAMNGFRNGGLWPVDSSVLTNADFAPSVVTRPPYAAKRATQNKLQGIMATFLWE
jgi:hypothetical protein